MSALDSDDEDSFVSSSSSEDEDEEFLTTSKTRSSKKKSNKSSSEDREALIRRKLLENFYGKSAAASADVGAGTSAGASAVHNGNANAGINAPPALDTSHSKSSAAAATSTKSTTTATIRTPTQNVRHTNNNRFQHLSPQSPSVTDLDSPSFEAEQYASKLISSSSTHTLLTSSSNLTQSIRLLDSTMQTLVYENYSKFIDATDAIRSIGQSVSVSEQGLNTLSSSICNIEHNMKEMEEQLKSRRNEVAEKIRVKRLLTRLTRLLELPVTLKSLCHEKKYRCVMKDYEDAMLIIGKHSEGFESLKNIEMDCGLIVGKMIYDLGKMIWVWCGGDERGRMIFSGSSAARNLTKRRSISSSSAAAGATGVGGIMGVSDVLDSFMRNGRMLFNISSATGIISGIGTGTGVGHDNDIHQHDGKESEDEQGDDQILDYDNEKNPADITSITDISLPQSISEIFECTGAVQTFSYSDKAASTASSASTLSPPTASTSNETSMLLSQLNEKECKVISLECCTRYLDGILEDHVIDVQEEKLKSNQEVEVRMAVGGTGSGKESEHEPKNGKMSLFPRNFLNTMLEAATLYGVTFNSQSTKRSSKKRNAKKEVNLLNHYVAIWFESFLGHVRMILLERISDIDSNKQSNSNSQDDAKNNAMVDDQDDKDDAAFADISRELMHLLKNVREAASGLALPEIGLDMELASDLVEQTVGITESMVKRRVTQKFNLLRVRVLKECLIPLVKDVASDGANSDSADSLNVIKTVQAANVALSDGLQMVDDTIRSILSHGSALGMSSTPLDSDMVKVAVRNNARKFAFWLASALENIAGCDPDNREITLNVKPLEKNNGHNVSEDEKTITSELVDLNITNEDEGESSEKSRELSILEDLCEFVQENMDSLSNGVLCLSLVEMCRLAGRNVSNNMNQSISSSMEEDSKHTSKKDVFQLSSQKDTSSVDSDGLVSTRFRLAAARTLTLFATMKGYEAASSVCHDIWESCSIQSEFFPHGPTEVSWKILEIAKSTSLDCAAAFGGDFRAGPIPRFNDDNNDYMQGGTMGGMGSGTNRHGAIKGLSLDVARMFTQKVQVYPHHSEMIDFSRNAVVALMLKVAFKAWIEQIRSCRFSAFAYRQLQVDIEFFKILLPHYIEEESMKMEELQTVISDIVLNAGERCEDVECVGVTEYYDEARGKVLNPTSIAMNFLIEEEAAGKRGVLNQFLIQDDNEKDDENN
jgi:hypothetical protein